MMVERHSHLLDGGPDVSGPYAVRKVAARHTSPGGGRLLAAGISA
jgi:hypothetical protein